MATMNMVQKAAVAAVERHGSISRAARATNIDRSVLSMLVNGQRDSASVETMRKLGLRLVPEIVAEQAGRPK
jgi:DNA-binding transcriptional LysR family regulator